MSRRLLAAALRPNQNRMGTALGQAVLRMHQRGMTKGKEDEEFYRLIRVQEEAYAEAMVLEKKRQGMPLPYPSLRLEEYNHEAAKAPHYPDAYLESKHTQPFAHWRTPKGVAEWAGFLAAQAFNAAAAAAAHVPAWLVRIPRDTVWFRRMLLLECIAPVPGAVASMAGHARALATMRSPGSFIQSYGRESDNARAHLQTLLQLRPSLTLRAFVLTSQAVFAVPYMVAYALSPRACHAFVCHLSGLTGEAISDALHDLDSGAVPTWQRTPAPTLAAAYWGLPEGATMRTVLLVMRADMTAKAAMNQAADPAAFKPGCQLATLEDILNEEYPLDYNMPEGPVVLRSQSNASTLSNATSCSSSGGRTDVASPTSAPTKRHVHSAARAAFQDAPPAKFGRAAPAASSAADPQSAPAGFRWRPRLATPPVTRHDSPSDKTPSAVGVPLPNATATSTLTAIDLTEEQNVQLHAVEEQKPQGPAATKGASEKFSTEGKQPDLAAIMESMWGAGGRF